MAWNPESWFGIWNLAKITMGFGIPYTILVGVGPLVRDRWATISVLVRDSFRACFVVPEVVPTILHFGNVVPVLILAKNVLFSFVRKIHEVTPTNYFDITAFLISYPPNGWIDLLMNHCT